MIRMPGKNFLKVIFYVTAFMALLAFALFDKIDTTSYKDQDFYRHTIKTFEESLPNNLQDSLITAGWAKANITPRTRLRTAGYGITKPYQAIGDSIYIKSIVLGNSVQKVVILTADLLIFPPLLARDLEQYVKHRYPEADLFFSATHTHSSTGGWSKGIAGKLMSGGFDETYYQFLLKKAIVSIDKAIEDSEPVVVSFRRVDAKGLVENRLVKEQGVVYPWLINLKLQKNSGEVAIIASFSAHPTCNEPRDGIISRDYPGYFTDSLESTKEINFAAFLAGPVGSHGPRKKLVTERSRLSKVLSDSLVARFFKSTDDYTTIGSDLLYVKKKVNLREPHLKISNTIRLRPWVYHLLIGEEQDITIRFLKLGNILLTGTPCDFSGELVPELDSLAYQNGLELMVTSFNGAYIGYITKDEHYHINKSETRIMNWYGPQNGQFFSELISVMIGKMGKAGTKGK